MTGERVTHVPDSYTFFLVNISFPIKCVMCTVISQVPSNPRFLIYVFTWLGNKLGHHIRVTWRHKSLWHNPYFYTSCTYHFLILYP